jgi:hypothetical protein
MNLTFVKPPRCHPERPSEPERRSERVERSAVAFQRTLDSPHVRQSPSILRYRAALLQLVVLLAAALRPMTSGLASDAKITLKIKDF